ncbi:MAG TPA: glycosyltransferase [Gemmatimonadales bacterium]
MKVVQVGKFYPPEYVGGLESVVVGINDELVRRGVGVTAVVAAVRGKGRTETFRGVEVVRTPTVVTLFSQPVAPGFAAAVKAAPGDVVHLHHPNPLGDVAVLGDPRPLVITQHSDIVRQRLLRPLYGPVLRQVFAKARRIAVGSAQLLASSSELKGFEDKTRVIPFGIDNSRFAATPHVTARADALRKRWGGGPLILAVGRLVGYKGFDVLIEAARGLAGSLVLVGTGPEESRLKGLAGPHVIFAGRLGDEDLVAAYHACDVFCLPSVSSAEAFGMVLLEAMACGKPLVTTALPTGVSAVNREGETGLVVRPGDVGELREALQALLADDARAEAMGAKGRSVQETEYTAELMGQRYLALYEEAVSGGAMLKA